MQNEEIAENVQTVFRKIEEKLRRGMNNIKTVYLKTTMGSTVKVDM
jgi:large subunit ribosomal protein L1